MLKSRFSRYICAITFLTVSLTFAQAQKSKQFADEDVTFDKGADLFTGSGMPDSATSRKLTEPPSVIQNRRYIKGKLQEDAGDANITTLLGEFNLKTAEGIQELFARFRDLDEKVRTADKASRTSKIEEIYGSAQFRKTFGVEVVKGTYFDVVGPKRIGRVIDAKKVVVQMAPEMSNICKAADAAFEKILDWTLMEPFMSWANVRGRIYVITEPKIWKQLNTRSALGTPVETVVSDEATREFYIYVSPSMYEYSQEAIGYAVAEMALREYSYVISGSDEKSFPLFFITGMAGEAGKLNEILTLMGPVQVNEVTYMGRTKKWRPVYGSQAPLAEKKLIPISELVEIKQFPARDEERYYFLVQSRVIIDELQDQATLAFASLVRSLADGADFKRQIGASYMDMQKDLEGREVKLVDPGKGKLIERTAAEKLQADWERFVKYVEFKSLFYNLTQEYFTEKKKEQIEEARKKKIEEEAAKEKLKEMQTNGSSAETD